MPGDQFLNQTRDGYHRTAEGYAERFHDHLDGKPLDRAVLAGFAELVRATGCHRVADLGCGTGATTELLAGAGLDTIGVDLAPGMVEAARRLNPQSTFHVGSMTERLGFADRSLGGVCAWYSIVHLPDEHLPGFFDELRRVLVPGGVALLAFQVGDEPRVLTEAFGQPVRLVFFRRRPERVVELCANAGLTGYARLVRQPDPDETTPQAFLLVRRPEAATEPP